MAKKTFLDTAFEMGLGKTYSRKKKRRTLTPAQRIYIWERPKKYGRKCNICGEKISKLSELALDHNRPYSKGGVKLKLAHKYCNQLKSNKSLGKIQKILGIKRGRKKKTNRKKEPQKDIFGLPKVTFRSGRWRYKY